MISSAILENDVVRLSPLKQGDWQKLIPLNREEGLWETFPYDLTSDESFKDWMESRIRLREEGKWMPYLVFYKKEGRPVGLSCYLNIDGPNKVIEIGGTWYGKPYQGTEVNPNCKLLLMTHAFETLEYYRVEFKTDALNARSRKAIEKLGAREDGILRSNRIVQGGRRRDTVYYSVLRDEWPTVKRQLQMRLKNHDSL